MSSPFLSAFEMAYLRLSLCLCELSNNNMLCVLEKECECMCGFVFWWESVFNKNDMCLGVCVRVSVVLVSLCEWVICVSVVHTRECEDCVSASRVFLLLWGRAALCPRSGGSGLSCGESLPQFPMEVCGAGGSPGPIGGEQGGHRLQAV